MALAAAWFGNVSNVYFVLMRGASVICALGLKKVVPTFLIETCATARQVTIRKLLVAYGAEVAPANWGF